MYNHTKYLFLFLILFFVGKAYSQSPGPVITNALPEDAFVDMEYQHLPAVDYALANPVTIINYQTSEGVSNASSQYRVNTYSTSHQHLPAYVKLDGGNYLIAWQSLEQDGSGSGIYAQMYTETGVATNSEFRLNQTTEGNQSNVALAPHSDGGFVAVWESENVDDSGYAVVARRFDSNGSPITDEIRVNQVIAADQMSPDIVHLSDGSYVVIWQSDMGPDRGKEIFARAMSSSLALVGSEWQANTYLGNDQERPRIATQSNDQLVVVWQSLGQDSSSYGTYYRRFTSDGTPLDTSEVMVNLAKQYMAQWLPEIAVLENDHFAITYTSSYQGEDTSEDGVFHNLYNADGGLVFSDRLVNTHVQSYQKDSSVVSLSGGGYVIAWNSYPQDGSGYGAYYQVYDASGNKVGEESLVAELTTGDQRLPILGSDNNDGFVAVFRSEWTSADAYWGVHARNFPASDSSETIQQNTEFTWPSSFHPASINQHFYYRENPDTSWVSVPIITEGDTNKVTVVGLQEGTYEYRIDFEEGDYIGLTLQDYFSVVAESTTQTDVLYFELTESPNGMQIDSATGEILWTPTESQIGNHAVSFTVWNTAEQSDSQNAIVTVTGPDTNTPPTVTSEPITQAIVDQQYTYPVIATDAETENLTYGLELAPSGMTIDSVTGVISWVPTIDQVGTHDVLVVVTDVEWLTGPQQYQVTVVEGDTEIFVPLITSLPIVSAESGSLYEYDVDAYDPSPDDVLTFSLNRLPNGMSIDSSTGLINWAAGGDYYLGVAQSAALCRSPIPDIGTFEPVLKWEWNSSAVESAFVQVMAPPAVAQINDDNDDGLINEFDTPDVIFPAFVGGVNSEAILRVLSGADGSEIFSISDPAYRVAQFSMPAIGDIDLDGRPEIVALGFQDKLFVFEDDGSLKWELEDSQLGLWSPNNYGSPSLADINQDGTPEIIFGTTVVSASGDVLWKGAGSHLGRNHWDYFIADYFTYALDWDASIPGLEIIAGASVYDQHGNLLWQNDVVGDGFTAVANFDLDSDPELVVVNDGVVSIIDNDGQLIVSSQPLPGNGVGGPPTVADMDGDGMPEIGVAGYGAYSVFNHDATLLWSAPTQDFSSHFTGSTIFDFDGDGRSEVVYADEINLYVYRGETGEVLFSIPNGSGTALEYPVVADVDNDNHAELILVRNYYQSPTPGIRVFEDANDSWVATRGIWNQYSYHIDNVRFDGSIPASPDKGWLSHNSFRLNAFGNRSPLALADLVVSEILVVADQSGAGLVSEFDAVIEVRNGGGSDALEAFTVFLYTDAPENGGIYLGQGAIAGLSAGASTEVLIENVSTSVVEDTLYAVIEAPSTEECVTNNNFARVPFVEASVADLREHTDHQIYAINVTPQISAPVITSESDSDPIAGRVFTYDVSAEGTGELTYSLVTAPEGMVINSETGVITWLPSESFEGDRVSVEVRVQGEQGLYDIQNFVLEVQPELNNPPEITKDTPCEFEQYPWLEISGSFEISEDQRTFSESSGYSGNAIGDLDLGLGNKAYWEIVTTEMDQDRSLGWGLIRDTETVLNPSGNTTWDHRASLVARTTYSWVADYGQGGVQLYAGTGAEAAFTIGDVLMVAWDQGRVYFGKNGIWWNNADPALGVGYIAENLTGFRPYLSHNNISGSSQYTVNSTNADFIYDSPLLCPDAGTSTGVGETYIFDADATDIDGDTLVFELLVAPENMSIDTETGVVQWTPETSDIGTHQVTVQVSDGRGGFDTYTYELNVLAPPNAPPLIETIPDVTIEVGEYFQYQVEATDPEGGLLDYSLGARPDGMVIDSATGAIEFTPTTGERGQYNVEVFVADEQEATAQTNFTITIENFVNDAPRIVSLPETRFRDPEYFYLVRVEDPDYGDTHTYYLDSAPTGMTIDSATGVVLWNPTPEQLGDNLVAVRVADSGGLEASQAYTLSYVNDPTAPVIISDPVLIAEEATLYQYDVDAIDPNPAEVLTYSLNQSPATMTINPNTGMINWYAYSPEGFTEISFDELEEGAHINDQYPGIHFTAYDQNGDPKPIFAEYHNDSRYVASENMYLGPRVYRYEPVYTWEINFDSPIDYFYIRVLDAEEPLTIETYRGNVKVGSFPQPRSGNPGHDFVVGQIGGTELFDRIVFLCDPGGPELFDNVKYHTAAIATVEARATNSLGKFDEQRFDIHFTTGNFPPEITSRPILGGVVDTEYSYQMTAVDHNSDPISFAFDQAPIGMQIDQDGLISWIPTLSDLGSHPVRILVSDNQGEAAVQEYVLTVRENDSPPIFTSLPILETYPTMAYEYRAKAYDPEGDEVHFYLLQGPIGMEIDRLDGLLEWTPTENDIGYHQITIEARGRFGYQTTEQSFELHVIGSGIPPRIVSVPVTSIYFGNDYIYDVEAVDADEVGNLTYQLLQGPTYMLIDELSGVISWVTSNNFLGENVIRVQVEDSDGLTDIQEFVLMVNEGNAYPQIDSTPSFNAVVDTEYVYNVDASDANANDVLTYTLDSGPSPMSIDSASGVLSWTPTPADIGAHEVRVRVTDLDGAYVQQYFTVTVSSADNEAPSITLSVSSVAPNVGDSVSIQIVATDNVGIADVTLEINGLSISLSNEYTATYIPATPGVHSMFATAIDTSGNSVSQSIDITATETTNTLPEITSTPIESATSGVEYAYSFSAIDADGDTLIYSLQTAPTGMSIDSATGDIIWEPTASQLGANSVVARVSDGNAYVEQNWSINVTGEVVLPFNAEIVASPKFVSSGEEVVVSVNVQNPAGEVSFVVTVNGSDSQLDANNELRFSPTEIGAHEIVLEVNDTVETVVLTESVYVEDLSDTTPPVAQIVTPEDDDEITEPSLIIGTASDENIAEYRILISERGKAEFSEIARGTTSISNGELGTIDPTMLLNGIYDLVLEVYDINGQVSADSVVFVVDGDMKLGEFTFTVDDINIPVAGVPVRVSRTYDTRRRSEALSFGQGWSVDYQNVRIMESRKLGHYWEVVETPYQYIFSTYCLEPIGERAPYVFVETPDGKLHKFDVVASIGGGDNCQDIDPALVNVSFVFEAREGTYSTLQSNEYTSMRMNGDDLSNFDENWGVVADPKNYTLTTEDGYIYSLDQGFGVQSVTDPYGNQLTYGANGITHSSGKGVNITRDAEGRIELITDPKGNTIEYSYDELGNLVQVTDRIGDATQYTYFNGHYLNEIIDANGVTVARAQYEGNGRLGALSDADGGTIQYVYNLAQNQHQVTDQMGRDWLYTYDEFGRITSIEDPDGELTTYGYDEFGNETSVSKGSMTITRTFNNRGRITEEFVNGQLKERLTYDDKGNVLTLEDGLGRVTTTTYDIGNQPLITELPGGRTIQNEYSATGVLNRVISPDGSETTLVVNGNDMVTEVVGPDGTVTNYDYDENNNQNSETRTRTVSGQPVTEVITHEYSADNRKSGSTFADGTTISMTYDHQGMTSMTSRHGRSISNSRNSRGYLTQITTDTGHTIQMDYDSSGNNISETDKYGNTKSFEYDAYDRVIRSINPDSSTTEVVYNLAGQKVSEKDANDNWTTFTYYPSGNLHKVIDSQAREVTYVYDLADRLISITNQKGRETTFQYDDADNLIQTNYPDGSFTRAEYDLNGRKLREWNEESHLTSFTYDAFNRLTQVTDASGESTQYGYDEFGNMISMTDAKGAITNWTYNSNRSILSRQLPLGESESFSYGLEGEISTRQDFNGNQTNYVYDEFGRLSEKQLYDGEIVTYSYAPNGEWYRVTDSSGSTTYNYDATRRISSVENSQGEVISYVYDGNGNTVSITTPNGTHQYSYDERNLMIEAIDPSLNVTSYEYDETGMVEKITYPNGVVTSYLYDLRDRPTRISHLDPLSLPIEVLDYGYDLAGNILTIDSSIGRSQTFTYDELNRLVSETVVDPQFVDYFYTYSYDENGNRTQRVGNIEVIDYDYDDNNRLVSAGSTSYNYDNEGNLLGKSNATNTWGYTYDSRNRLVSADVPGNSLSFNYDTANNRIGRTLNGVSTSYLWDTNRDNARLMASYDNGGALENLHHYGLGRISENNHYFLKDYKDSTTGISNSDGDLTDRFAFDAFGNLRGKTGTNSTEFTYNGEQMDHELGMQYLRARYYDPEVGRFSQMDTWAGRRTNPTTLNKYIYADANPVMGIDPSGRFTLGSLGASQNIIGIMSTYAIRTGGRAAVACAKTMARFYARAGAGVAKGSKSGFLRKIKGGGDCAAVAWGSGFAVGFHSGMQLMPSVAKAAPSWGCYTGSSACFRYQVNRALFGINRNPFMMDWHHIVEKNHTQFDKHAINSVANIAPTPRGIHRSYITPYFSSGKYTGMPLRKWLKSKDYKYHWRLGVVVWYKAVSGQWSELKNTRPGELAAQ